MGIERRAVNQTTFPHAASTVSIVGQSWFHLHPHPPPPPPPWSKYQMSFHVQLFQCVTLKGKARSFLKIALTVLLSYLRKIHSSLTSSNIQSESVFPQFFYFIYICTPAHAHTHTHSVFESGSFSLILMMSNYSIFSFMDCIFIPCSRNLSLS